MDVQLEGAAANRMRGSSPCPDTGDGEGSGVQRISIGMTGMLIFPVSICCLMARSRSVCTAQPSALRVQPRSTRFTVWPARLFDPHAGRGILQHAIVRFEQTHDRAHHLVRVVAMADAQLQLETPRAQPVEVDDDVAADFRVRQDRSRGCPAGSAGCASG